MKLMRLFAIFLLVTACHRKNEPEKTGASTEVAAVSTTEMVKKSPEKKKRFSRVFRESVFFAKSLEREALKLLLKDSAQQQNTLFSVLSYIVENDSGVRKSTPTGLDCGKFDISEQDKTFVIKKACRKPYTDAIYINTVAENAEYETRFVISQWGAVLGMSAVFAGSDIKCRLRIIEQKLETFSCENWTHQISESLHSVTVLKASEFLFQRHAEKQFVIKGGFYKDLIQNKKIDVTVPLEGKIKIFEQELKVIDEFATQRDGVTDEKKESVEIKPSSPEKNINKEIENQNQNKEAGQVPSEGEVKPGSEGGSAPERRGR